ncbi:uncharacterized protein V1518DRAFT_422563 [Limtongia smithiae]|uniref:uncharacterized protein n=1 Tax=Limtongia smithiae TaxID=1125753 RepID=UPI0034CD504A
MSVIFPFPLPTTGAFAFSQCIPSTEHYHLIAEADARRARLRDTLKRAKRRDIQDMVEVVKAIDDYIPYLFTIKRGIEAGGLLLDSEIVTSWRMPLSKSHINMVETSRVSAPTIYYEVCMTMLTYALALLALAEEIYQVGQADEKWKQTTAHLLTAQSILIYLSTHPLQLSTPVPIDLQPSTLSFVVYMISGSLHLLIIYKSLPSPSAVSKPPVSSLMSRVSIYALEKFTTAASLLPQALRNDALESWVKEAKAYSTAVAGRYMAIENESKQNVGVAIAQCAAALAALKSGPAVALLSKPKLLHKSSSSSAHSSAAKYRGGLQSSMKPLREELEKLEKEYRNQNDKLTFQKIPDIKEVKRNWPSGREVVVPKPEWTPTGSLVSWDDEEDDDEDGNAGPARAPSYGGQGQYY